MKTLLLCTVLLTSALAAVSLYPPNESLSLRNVPLPGNSASHTLRIEIEGGWEGSINSFLEDPDAERVRKLQEIESYAQGVNAMTRNCGESRGYLHTRVKALQEHAEYAREELLVLPADSYDEDFTRAHAHFYTTMNGLREAYTQALAELNQCK